LKETPTVASVILSEVTEILDHLKTTLKEIDESVAKKEPLFHYGPKELRNPRNPEFWNHNDEFLTTSLTARMRFVHVKNNRYQFMINSPIVLGSKRFDDYLGELFMFISLYFYP